MWSIENNKKILWYYNKKVMQQLKMAATEIVESQIMIRLLLSKFWANYSNVHIKWKVISNMISWHRSKSFAVLSQESYAIIKWSPLKLWKTQKHF